MLDEDIESAARDLGLHLVRVSTIPIKVKSFIHRYKNGLYLVGTFDHVFVVDNGVMVDPRNKKPPGLYRMIKYLWRVE
jgi:hypothetical protein